MIEVEKRKIEEIANRYKLSLVVLFGSQATDRFHQKSDIDIAILSWEKFDIYKLMTDFSEVFKRDDVEVVDIDPNSASPTLMHAVVRDGKLLYEKNTGDFLRWKLYAIKIWLETAWLRDLRDKKLIEWAEKGQLIDI